MLPPLQAALPRVAHLIVMPDGGVRPVVDLLEAARTSIRIKMFSFDSPTLVTATVAAVARGVTVRVMLNPRRSSGIRPNDTTLRTLRRHGVATNWTSPEFSVTHEKSVVVDDACALVCTFDFNDKYFAVTRDYGLVIDELPVVAQVAACFDADWRREPYFLPVESPLALGNTNARTSTAAVIDSAQDTLLVQHPKYSDMTIVDRLVQAHARGVHVHVLCAGHHGITDADKLDTYSALRSLQQVGIHLRHQHKLRLHAKLIIADGRLGVLGSMNIDRNSYEFRRELGVVFNDKTVLHRLRQHYYHDWKEARRYIPPDPLALQLPVDPITRNQEASSSDPTLIHE